VTVFENSRTMPASLSGKACSTESIAIGCKESKALGNEECYEKREEVEKGVYCFRLELPYGRW
jgi:hypothetical protein